MPVQESPPLQAVILMELVLNLWSVRVATTVVNVNTVKPLEPALKDVQQDTLVLRITNVVLNVPMDKLLKAVATMDNVLLDLFARPETSAVQVNSIITQVNFLLQTPLFK